MAGPSEVRKVAVAFLGLFAASASLAALTPLNWPAVFLLAVAVASVLILIDIFVFKNLMKHSPRTRRKVMFGLSALTIACLVALSVVVAKHDEAAADGYPYLVANSSDSATEVKAVPSAAGGTLDVVFSGDEVRVSCYVEESKRRWYKLEGREGWLPEVSLLASPHTGLGSPPRCPD